MKVTISQGDYLSIPIGFFENHFVLLFVLTSKQDGTGSCPCLNLVGELLRLEINNTHTPELVTELVVLGERMSSVAVDRFGNVAKNSETE